MSVINLRELKCAAAHKTHSCLCSTARWSWVSFGYCLPHDVCEGVSYSFRPSLVALLFHSLS